MQGPRRVASARLRLARTFRQADAVTAFNVSPGEDVVNDQGVVNDLDVCLRSPIQSARLIPAMQGKVQMHNIMNLSEGT